jgi:hypothetical protein
MTWPHAYKLRKPPHNRSVVVAVTAGGALRSNSAAVSMYP